MGVDKPFRPRGHCRNCKFSEPTTKSQYQHQHHALVCRRFPPTGAGSAPGDGPWSRRAYVHGTDYCGEWRDENAN